MEKVLISTSPEDTKQIAEDFVGKLESGTVVCLSGALAAGKTTFSQYIGKFLGIDRMTSPTFVIMRQYPVTKHPKIKTLYHLDLYRLESPEEIKAFNLEEIWSDPTNLLLIEWPEKFLELLPKDRFDISLKSTGPFQREITIREH
jgi:tRNA threonylcarbamoyladenosine biosynthesis protein TsaE